MAAARSAIDSLAKPVGSLGRLEEVLVWLAGVTGTPSPTLEDRTILVAAGDHGVVRQGVSAWPQDVTSAMVANFLGGGAAISSFARSARASLVVVDIGVANTIPPQLNPVDPSAARLLSRRVRDGTRDFTVGPALTTVEVEQAMAVGREIVGGLVGEGRSIVAVGEMGIGNTTSASAIVAALTGLPPDSVTGIGAGVDAVGRARKVAAIERGLALNQPDPADPLSVLAAVGGLEIACLVGVMLAAGARQIPVVLDGFITGAAALLAARIEPALPRRLLASHRSTEPGHAVVLDTLGLRPLLELELRLGEATGAALALLLVSAAVNLRESMTSLAAVADTPPSGVMPL